jgi:outer membrane protein assembly factor BamB
LRAIAAAVALFATSPARAADEATKAAEKPGETARDGHDWAEFLGPHGNGVSDEKGLADKWPENGPPVLWEKEVGTGYSAPSVRGDRVVLHHRKGGEEIVECFRAENGESLWSLSYPSGFADPYGYNNGPRCTPLLSAERCYTYGAEGMLYCVDLSTGKEIWHRDTKAEFDLPEWFFGVGATPILEGDLLIVLVGGRPNSGVVAFDAATGKTVWERVGKETWDGADTRGE